LQTVGNLGGFFIFFVLLFLIVMKSLLLYASRWHERMILIFKITKNDCFGSFEIFVIVYLHINLIMHQTSYSLILLGLGSLSDCEDHLI
jgi:hypothetical protein